MVDNERTVEIPTLTKEMFERESELNLPTEHQLEILQEIIIVHTDEII